MYDVRCTIAKFARVARNLAEQVRAVCRETVRGDNYKAAVAGGAAYVRGTMYDVRFGSSRALRGGGGANAKRNFEGRDRA